MNIFAIKSYIMDGGKFYIPKNGKIHEIRFTKFEVKFDGNQMRDFQWTLSYEYEVAGFDGVEKNSFYAFQDGKPKELIASTSITTCGRKNIDNYNDLFISADDLHLALNLCKNKYGLCVDDRYPKDKRPCAYVWNGFEPEVVYPYVTIDLLHDTMRMWAKNGDKLYKTEHDCEASNHTYIVCFSE